MRESLHGYGTAAFATKDFKKGELILELTPNFKKHADQHTARIDKNLHQTTTDENAAENYLNHSCEPTGAWNFGQVNPKGNLRIGLYATRNIKAGEELTYNYFTTDFGRGPREKREKTISYADVEPSIT